VPLPSAVFYEALLQRQQAGEILDLSGVIRPGIAVAQGERLIVLQGAGRFEQLRRDQYMDLFVPEGEPLPAGVLALERGVAGELVCKANLLSSRGQSGANPELVDAITQGGLFVRVLAPRARVEAPFSHAAYEVEKLRTFLEDMSMAWDAEVGPRLRKYLKGRDFQELSLVEQGQTLRRLVAAAGASPAALETNLPVGGRRSRRR